MTICGGVNSILYPDILIPLAKARMVSPTGQCQAFSDTADGYIVRYRISPYFIQSYKCSSSYFRKCPTIFT